MRQRLASPDQFEGGVQIKPARLIEFALSAQMGLPGQAEVPP